MSALINIKVDPDGSFSASVNDLVRRQLPYATMQALNSTAFEVRKSWTGAITGALDRPTAFTRNSPLVTRASKSDLFADVFVRDRADGGNAPATYLQDQVFGGDRRRKGLENKLTGDGALPDGMYAVPGQGARKDSYGNMPRGQVRQIIAAFSGAGSGRLFALNKPHGKLRPGVYRRLPKKGLQILLRFVSSGKYAKRLDLFEVATKVYARRFQKNFDAQLKRAVASSFARGARP